MTDKLKDITRTLEQRGSLLALLREPKKNFPKALMRDIMTNLLKERPCYPCVEEYKGVVKEEVNHTLSNSANDLFQCFQLGQPF